MPPQRIALVTGKLAAPFLRRLVPRLEAETGVVGEVVELGIAVAALTTAEWAARRISLPAGVSRAIVTGYLRGDLGVLEEATGVPFERGPKELRDLPAHLGGTNDPPEDYGVHAIEIVAEINHVPGLPADDLLREAHRLREAGADIIDLGCDPDGPFAEIGDRVRLLKDDGFRVSVDSLDPREIVPAVEAGAELVLSVNGTNLDVARDLGCEVVAIPDSTEPGTWLPSLTQTVEQLRAWDVPYRLDPVLEPIGFGLAASLGRYLEVRRRFPEDPVLMGVGNLTELTDADTAGLNVLLLGFCAELGIGSVLTTSVIHWARSTVRELDLGRRLVHWAVAQRSLPKRLEPGLHLLRDAEAPTELDPADLEKLAAAIRDRNFRIFAGDDRVHVVRAGEHLEGADPFELFAKMQVDDPSHAFYLGYEMAKAVTALTLGKRYTQDEPLSWGFLTRPEHWPRARKRRNIGNDIAEGGET